MKLLYLPRTPVDFEHMLPFMQLVNDEMPQVVQKFCFLNAAYDPYANKDIRDWCPRHFELSPATFVSNIFMRQLMTLMYACEKRIRRYFDNYLPVRLRQARVHYFGKVWNLFAVRIKQTRQPETDIIIISENNAGSILLKKNWNLFQSICNVGFKKILIIPESYDSYSDRNEFYEYMEASKTRDFESKALLLGRVNKDYLPNEMTSVIGIPRYSRWWCEALMSLTEEKDVSDFPVPQTILYLAQKRRDWDPVYSKVQDEIDADLWRLLKDNPGLYLIIKPHPKGNWYKGIEFHKDIKNRILIIEDVSTIALSRYSSIVVSVWTSIIPCFLRLKIPVVLLRTEEAGRMVQPELKGMCGGMTELQMFAKGKRIEVKENTEELLNVFFEAGQKNYVAYLKCSLEKIFHMD